MKYIKKIQLIQRSNLKDLIFLIKYNLHLFLLYFNLIFHISDPIKLLHKSAQDLHYGPAQESRKSHTYAKVTTVRNRLSVSEQDRQHLLISMSRQFSHVCFANWINFAKILQLTLPLPPGLALTWALIVYYLGFA